MGVAVHEFISDDPDDLHMAEGDQVAVFEEIEEFWWKARHLGNGKVGSVPTTHFEFRETPAAKKLDWDEDTFETVFRRIDADNSGTIEKDEIEKFASTLFSRLVGKKKHPERQSKVFSMFGLDDDSGC